jgi:hypothetical protein
MTRLDKTILQNATRNGRNPQLLRAVATPSASRIPMTEDQEQQALIELCELNENRIPELRWLFAVPNGELRKKSVAARLQKQGVKAGVADLILLEPRDGFHGLAIELKAKGGTASPAQKEWLRHHAERGYSTWVCEGHAQAWNVLKDYLGF